MVAKKPTAEEISSSFIRDSKPQVSFTVVIFVGSFETSMMVVLFDGEVLTVVLVGDLHFIGVLRDVCLEFVLLFR